MSPLLLGLLGLVVKASLVLAVTAGAAAVLRRRSAASRHLVWVLGLSAAVALPLLEAVVPARPVAVVPAPTAEPSPDAPSLPPPAAAVPGRVSLTPDASPTQSGPHTGTSRPEAVEAPPLRSLALPTSVGGWLALVWAVGAALFLGRFLGGVLRLAYWSRRAALVTDPAWLGLAHALAGRLGMHRGVTLLRGTGPAVPMTWGVLRPVIWIPEGADAWDDERRAVVLAHELAHVRRRDALTQWVAHVALALHWYNPLAHIAARRLRAERERACDDAVLALGTAGATYADHLLAIVRALGERRGPSLAFAMARKTQFEGRLLAVLDTGALRQRPRRVHVALAAAVALGLLVPLAALRPAMAERAGTPVARVGEPATPRALPLAPVDTTEAALRELAGRYGISAALARRVVVAAQQEGVPATTAFALVEGESGFRSDLVSERGAVGLTQVLPSTAATLAPGTTRADLLDPETNLRLGLRSLRRLLDRYDGRVDAAFAAYHAGPERVDAVQATTTSGTLSAPSGARPSTAAPGRDGGLSELVQTIGSDGERERLLRQAIAAEPLTDGRQADVLAAARHIGSPGDRARVYQTLIGQGLDVPSQVRLLAELATLRSPGDVARVLGVYLGRYGLDATTADAFCRAAEAMGSSGDHSTVLRTALGARPDDAALGRLLVSAGRIASDGDKANVLLSAAPLVRTDRLRGLYLAAARTIGSDGDKANVLAVLAASGEPAAPTGAASGSSQFDIHAHDVRLTPSGDDVEATGPGGVLDLTETTPSGVRRVVIRPGAGGTSYAYTVDGVARPVDAAARAWIREAVRHAARAGGI